jgi:hypothetical protein
VITAELDAAAPVFPPHGPRGDLAFGRYPVFKQPDRTHEGPFAGLKGRRSDEMLTGCSDLSLVRSGDSPSLLPFIEINLNETQQDAPTGVFFVMLDICPRLFSFTTSRHLG